MSTPGARDDQYASIYRYFDAPLMRRVRQEAYGDDIGQHSWVSAAELRADIPRLALTPSSRLLDLGCGPCGPLTFVLATVGCTGTGVDASDPALESGRARATELGVAHALTTLLVDLDTRLPLEPTQFDAVMSLDVILHLRDRAKFFAESRRLLRPGGRFLLTDAAVLTGVISSDELQQRGLYGSVQLVPPGLNERLLTRAGFRVIDSDDRTDSVLEHAEGRLAALRHYATPLA